MIRCHLSFFLVSGLVPLASAGAIPWIEMSSDLALPAHLNPGQSFEGSCVVHLDGTEAERLRVYVEDPTGAVIYDWESTDDMWHDVYWASPEDATWGIYDYRAEYYTAGGELAAGNHVSFLVAAGGICAFKFIDADGNGEFDQDTEELAEGWEICGTAGPEDLGCEVTDEDGVACWFLIETGAYELCETLLEGWESTTGICQEVDLIEGDVAKVFFGNRPITTPTENATWSSIKSRFQGE